MVRIVAKGRAWETKDGRFVGGVLPSLEDTHVFDEAGKDISASFVGPIEIIIQAGEPIMARLTAIVAELDIEAVEVPR